ncbi:MAG: flagellar motor protein MotB [Pseudomonadota bacterium]
MAKKRKGPDAGEQINPLGWMVTFSDLITLLLTFFVLLISMSSMDVKSMQNAFGMFFTGGSGPLYYSDQGQIASPEDLKQVLESMPKNLSDENEGIKNSIFDLNSMDLQSLMELTENQAASVINPEVAITEGDDYRFKLEKAVKEDVSVLREDGNVIIRMNASILFNEGGAELKREFIPVLGRLGTFLRSVRQSVSIEGHTDGSPLEGGEDFWAYELSLDRAISVLKYFTNDEGIPEERFRVGGFGPARPAEKGDAPQAGAKNRRVEIILYKEILG